MPPGKVQCPICDRTINEVDINLHLDLQCPGRSAGPSNSPRHRINSTSGSTKSNTWEASQSSPLPMDEPTLIPTGSPGRRTGSLPQSNQSMSGRKRSSSSENIKAGQKKNRVNSLAANQPLAERSRPLTLATFIGQEDLVGPDSLLRARIESGEGVGSCILWGPPGSGKTTLARLIARTSNADYKELSATSAGTADVRQVFEQARSSLQLRGRKTILVIDEIHRFSKSQQDLFLPYVENGWVELIGATTENPSFKINGALLSRCQVFTLSPLSADHLQSILQNAVTSFPPPCPPLPPDLLPFLADVADGDARQALNSLEIAWKICATQSHRHAEMGDEDEMERRNLEIMETIKRGLRKGYDRTGEERFDMISALHKSLRGSDGSAAMYWLARMITGGEDPLYIARRLVVVASEDVGLADPHALPLAMATYQACQVIGLPECRINLAHCVAYLAEASKSTRSYTAYKRAEALAQMRPLPGVPLQIRNAPTQLMKSLGYGRLYSYNPDFSHPVHNEYLPFELEEYSSLSSQSDKHILKTPVSEARDKLWDEDRLAQWEWKVNGSKEWIGRTTCSVKESTRQSMANVIDRHDPEHEYVGNISDG